MGLIISKTSVGGTIAIENDGLCLDEVENIGTVTFITGGSSCLGKGAVEHFLKGGSNVVIFDKMKHSYRSHDNLLPIMGNITSEEDVGIAMNMCKEKFGRLDHVINCAGIHKTQLTYAFKQKMPHSEKNFNEMLNVNIGGRFNVIRQAVSIMKDNEPDQNEQRGVIINIGGIAASDGMIGQAAIAACEGGIASMTLPISRDLAEIGIRVVCIAPGIMDTAIQNKWSVNILKMFKELNLFPRRFGLPSEFGKLCETVCENPVLNGEVIRFDCGARLSY